MQVSISAIPHPSSRQRREFLGLVREWSALRKADHQSAQRQLARERWLATKPKVEAQAETAARTARQEQAWEPIRWFQKDKERQAALADLIKETSPEDSARITECCNTVRWPAMAPPQGSTWSNRVGFSRMESDFTVLATSQEHPSAGSTVSNSKILHA